MKRFICAIDPDIKSNAIAIWDRQEQDWFDVSCVPFEKMDNHFAQLFTFRAITQHNTTIYVEAGWKNQVTNFHRGNSFRSSEKIAMNVGMNHAVSMLTARYLASRSWEVVEIAPVSKAKGYLKNARGWTKVGREYIDQKSGLSGLNDDKRCAILIAMTFR